MPKTVIISKHPSGNLDSENRMQGCIQATCLNEIDGQSTLVISSLENRPLLLIDPETGDEILSSQTAEGSGLAPKKSFSPVTYKKLQAFDQKIVGFNRLGGDFLHGKLTVVSLFEYSIQIILPSNCVLPYEWPSLPKTLTDRYMFADTNLGLASFWRITRLCHDIETKKPYILKVIPRVFLVRGEGRVEQTLLELEFLKQCRNERIVYSEVQEDENNIFILQEASISTDCENLLKLPLSTNAKKYILNEMVQAIGFVHKAGFVHNRITGDRFKLFYSALQGFQVKLIDFGYIGRIDTRAAIDWWAFDVAAGSAEIDTVSPERITKDLHIVSELTDIYSLGTIFRNVGFEDPIINRMLSQERLKRPTINEVSTAEFFSDIDRSFALSEIKSQLFRQFFAKRYESFFFFASSASTVEKEKHKQDFLYASVEDLSKQPGSIFDDFENSIIYQDQVTNTMGWPSVTNILPIFEYPETAFAFRIQDLIQPDLPEQFLKYIDKGEWQKIRYELKKQVVGSGDSTLADPEWRPFSYKDLERPTDPIEIEASTMLPSAGGYAPETNLNVLSMPIKMPEQVAKWLNSSHRRARDGQEFDGQTIYLPAELINGYPSHVLINIMCTLCLEYFVNPKKLADAYAYLTLRKGVVSCSGSNKLGHGGWHVDGLWGARTKHFPPNETHSKPTSDRQYIMTSSYEMRTEWTGFGVNFSPLEKVAASYGLTLEEYLNKDSKEPIPPAPIQKVIENAIEDAIVKCGESEVVHYLPANRLAFFDSRVIHRAPVSTTGQPILRSSFRCAFSSDPFCKLGVTVNPFLGPITPLLFYSIEKPIVLDAGSEESKFIQPGKRE